MRRQRSITHREDDPVSLALYTSMAAHYSWLGLMRSDGGTVPSAPCVGLRCTMLFMTTYRVKPFLPKSETKKLLELFGKVGDAPGTVAHYIAVDNSAGWTISEQDDSTVAHASVLQFSEYIEFDTRPVLTIADALPQLLEAYQ